jgi:hypothetical protein
LAVLGLPDASTWALAANAASVATKARKRREGISGFA